MTFISGTVSNTQIAFISKEKKEESGKINLPEMLEKALADNNLSIDEYLEIKQKYLENNQIKAPEFVRIIKEDINSVIVQKSGKSECNIDLFLDDDVKDEISSFQEEITDNKLPPSDSNQSILTANDKLFGLLKSDKINTKEFLFLAREIKKLKGSENLSDEDKENLSVLVNNFSTVLLEGINTTNLSNINFDDIKTISKTNQQDASVTLEREGAKIRQSALMLSLAKEVGVNIDPEKKLEKYIELSSSKLIETANDITKDAVGSAVKDVQNVFSSLEVILTNPSSVAEPRKAISELINYLEGIPKNDPQFQVLEQALKDDGLKSLYYGAILASSGDGFSGVKNAIQTLGAKDFNKLAENILLTDENLKNISSNSDKAIKISKIIGQIDQIAGGFENAAESIRDIRQRREDQPLVGFVVNTFGTKQEEIEKLEGQLIEAGGMAKSKLLQALKSGNPEEFKKQLSDVKEQYKGLNKEASKLLDSEIDTAGKAVSTLEAIETASNVISAAVGIGAIAKLGISAGTSVLARQIGKRVLVRELGEEGLKKLGKETAKKYAAEIGSKVLSEATRKSLPTFSRIGVSINASLAKTGSAVFSEVGWTRNLVGNVADTAIQFVNVDHKTGKVKFSAYDFDGNFNYLGVIAASAPFALGALKKLKNIHLSEIEKADSLGKVKPNLPEPKASLSSGPVTDIQPKKVQQIKLDDVAEAIKTKLKQPGLSPVEATKLESQLRQVETSIEKSKKTGNIKKIISGEVPKKPQSFKLEDVAEAIKTKLKQPGLSPVEATKLESQLRQVETSIEKSKQATNVGKIVSGEVPKKAQSIKLEDVVEGLKQKLKDPKLSPAEAKVLAEDLKVLEKGIEKPKILELSKVNSQPKIENVIADIKAKLKDPKLSPTEIKQFQEDLKILENGIETPKIPELVKGKPQPKIEDIIADIKTKLKDPKLSPAEIKQLEDDLKVLDRKPSIETPTSKKTDTENTLSAAKKLTAIEQVFNDHPKLKVLEGVLRVDDYDNPIVRQNVSELSHFPEETLKKLKDAGIKDIHIANRTVPDLDSNGALKGVQPRNWEAGQTWDIVPGSFNPDKGSVAIGVGSHGCDSLAVHETAHALGYYLGFDKLKEVEDAHKRLFSKLDPYLQGTGPAGNSAGMEEMFAEALATLLNKGEAAAIAKYDQIFIDFLKNTVLK